MRSVIYNITSPYWSGNYVIYVLRIQVVLFPIQDEVVSVNAQVYRYFSAEKNKREDITVLLYNQ